MPKFDIFILFLIYLAIMLCVLGEFLNRDVRHISGGAFDISTFLKGLKKKKAQGHIEVEIKLLRPEFYENIEKYIRGHKHLVESNTTNRIWSLAEHNLIETIADGKSTWSTKRRISKFMLPVGKMTIALENNTTQKGVGEPNLIRQKNRISAPLNKHWRIDYTEVDGNRELEVEFEYVAKDFWNAIGHIKEIEQFLTNLDK